MAWRGAHKGNSFGRVNRLGYADEVALPPDDEQAEDELTEEDLHLIEEHEAELEDFLEHSD